MALKDWKKTWTDGEGHEWKWSNKKSNRSIRLWYMLPENIWIFETPYGKQINIKSKSQALKYAKAYMKKH